MSGIEKIQQPVSAEFRRFGQEYERVFSSDNPLMNSVYRHLLASKGKQIRPTLVLLAAKLCGSVGDATILSAISLEMLHTASLIHDDVVDDADERRGLAAVHTQWSNQIAVLSGDYVLSSALNKAVETNNLRILALISSLGKSLADGELLQLSNTKKSLQSEDDYFTVIRKKTALLFSVCTAAGAVSAGATDAQIDALAAFGERLGMCFQIQDDIFDFSENKNIGKPVGNDIREGKITLPLILALKDSPDGEIMEIIESKHFTKENIEKVISFVRQKNGIAMAQAVMEKFRSEAVGHLGVFPECDEKRALVTLLDYTIKRDK